MTNSVNILVVDDEQFFRDSIRFFLEDLDYNVIEAENGRIGVEKIQSMQPDLVLIDLYMPEMTGLDVLEWKKDHAPDVPVIIISGAGVIQDVAQAIRLGAWDYIFKPIEDLSILKHAIEKTLERAYLIQQNKNYQANLEEEVVRRTQDLVQANAQLTQHQELLLRSGQEEKAIGVLLKNALESESEELFLLQTLRILLEQGPDLSHLQQGAIYLASDDQLGPLVLKNTYQMTPEQFQFCQNAELMEAIYQRFRINQVPILQISMDGVPSYLCLPASVDQRLIAILLIFVDPARVDDQFSTDFIRRVTDVLSMGIGRFEAERKIQYLAYHDANTDLPNRTMLIERLQQEILVNRRNNWKGALLLIGLDRFKNLIDSLGHDLGDELLRQVANRLRSLSRAEDMVARLGGDQFMLLVNERSMQEEAIVFKVQHVAEKIRSALVQPYMLQGNDIYISCSVGISLFPSEQEDATEILKHADAAMFRAKAEGGDTHRFYQPQMQKAADARLQVEKDLRKARELNQLELYYQPQVQVTTGLIIGAEALLRWKHPERGFVSPLDFIPVAEETGLIIEIGEWVLQTAAQQVRTWEADGLLEKFGAVAVNVSPLQFRQPNFVDLVIRVFREASLSPARIKIEITESIIIESVEDVIRKMHAIKELGVQFSLDDFGTGYSSLSYLRRLPLDQLKIDRSFVQGITRDASESAIVETIISMGHHLGMDVIAEGVETTTELEFLRAKGCNAFQGFLFSKPVPANEFAQLLSKPLAVSELRDE